MYELRKQKNDIRKDLLRLRKDITPEQQAVWDKKITNTFLSSISYRFCDVILIYSSMENEISTETIITHALNAKKIVACPISDLETNTLSFRVLNSLDERTAGGYGILEPPLTNPTYSEYLAENRKGSKPPLAICVVPCLSYDAEGYRIGYGKGYYDRFLSSFDGTKIGLCYTNCKSKQLPRGKYDVKLDVVVTEKSVEVFK